MSVSQQIAAFLPFLRSYARALTGNQASGDAYVAATIQAMIEDAELAKLGPNPKVSLYRLFSKIWNSVSINTQGSNKDTRLPADQHLGNITPLPRQAFLLMSLEGFNESDAAQILDIDTTALRGHVAESGR